MKHSSIRTGLRTLIVNLCFAGSLTVTHAALPIVQPLLRSTWPAWRSDDQAADVKVAGSHAYVAIARRGLAVINISDRTNFAQVGGCDTRGVALGLAVLGNYAYIADYDRGLGACRTFLKK